MQLQHYLMSHAHCAPPTFSAPKKSLAVDKQFHVQSLMSTSAVVVPRARTTQLLDVATLQKAIETAITEAKTALEKAVLTAVEKVAKSVGDAIVEALQVVKAQLKELADKAAKAATDGLDTLKGKLSAFPKTVEDALTGVCDKLPKDPDVQTPCKDGVPKLITKVTDTVGSLCTEGVKTMMTTANSTCKGAATSTEEIVTKAGAECVTLSTNLPAQLAKPIADACNKASSTLATMPKEVIDTALGVAQKAADTLCTAVGGKAKIAGKSAGMVLATSQSMAQLATQAELETTVASLKDEVVKAMTDAKGSLEGVAKEALVEALKKVTETIQTVLKEGLEPIKKDLQDKADGLATTATGGLKTVRSQSGTPAAHILL